MKVRMLVFIPAYNEAGRIIQTLESLSESQDTEFKALVTDNASTDGTAVLVEQWKQQRKPPFEVEVHTLASKSVDAAWHYAFSWAEQAGYTHVLRTDADCLVEPDWTVQARKAFADGAEMVLGPVRAREDEHPTIYEKYIYPLGVSAATLVGIWINRSKDGVKYRTRYRYATGGNMGLSVATWKAMPAPVIPDLLSAPEDLAWANAARQVTGKVRFIRSMRVQESMRRGRAWGTWKLLGWHWHRKWVPQDGQVDIR